jgi:hypothetical protein
MVDRKEEDREGELFRGSQRALGIKDLAFRVPGSEGSLRTPSPSEPWAPVPPEDRLVRLGTDVRRGL